ncbi:DUF6728 family protein [Pedobacter hartonius]|uniref:DUF6728 family protein n=1 Tax=Pedobacter hartonius TaxID=425514 RepID=UPI00293713AF|nr:DUF6728 family protein [Pedobacter hartonius]
MPQIVNRMTIIIYICPMYFFRKKDPNRPTSIDIKIMHVVNVLAISIFLIGIISKLFHLV